MRRVGLVLAGLLWFAVIFLVAFRFTFPSDALVERASYELDHATGGTWAMEAGSVAPWWVGLKARDVTLYSVDRDGEATPALTVDVARARVSPTSLLSDPHGVGSVKLGTGRIDFDVVLDREAGYRPSDLKLEADGFPLTALPPIQGTRLEGRGEVDLEVDLEAPEGIRKAEGSASLRGREILVEGLSGAVGQLVGTFDVLPLLIEELDLEFDITQGKAEVRRGRLVSSLADVELSGDILLQENLANSRLRLKATIDLKEDGEQFAGFLSGAHWESDGRYHYTLSGTFGSSIRPRPERERRATARPTTPRPARPETAKREPSPETVEAARDARQKRLEALGRDGPAERPERLTGPAVSRDPRGREAFVVDDEEMGEEYDDEEYYDDEELPDEELLDDELLEEIPLEEF